MADRIPTEMIEKIFVSACYIDRPTCATICRTNRLGRDVATPILYETIGCEDFVKDGDYRTRKLALLLGTLLRNRKLARHVRRISHRVDRTLYGRCYGLPPPLDYDAFNHLITEELRLCDDVLEAVLDWTEGQRYIPTVPPRDVKKLESEQNPWKRIILDAAPLLALLILACPEVETLKLRGRIDTLWSVASLNQILTRDPYERSGTEEILEYNRNHGCWSVRNTELCVNEDSPETAEQIIQDLIYLPGLKFLRIEQLWDGVYQTPRSTATSSTIQHLEILDLGLGIEELTPLITHCNMLKTLVMSWEEMYDHFCHTDASYRIDWRRFGEETLRWTRQLEELKLDMKPEVVRPDWAWVARVTGNHEIKKQINFCGIGDLKALKRLRKVTAPDFVLFGYFEDKEQREDWTLDEILPASCQEVEIFCADPEFSQTDRELLSSPGTERLEDVTIFNCRRVRDDEWTRERWISKRNGEGMTGGIKTF
ncbi:Hypothetical predicted protein [Lecanosticta acicola]|uniref:Uncharacterized protein n=1 Tax=Lecanosticta acicola TaxID=111012 RepID=A0AAI9E845_9PEZI|nr:Hypothetical predicted protein [Lecanosticta acicola]